MTRTIKLAAAVLSTVCVPVYAMGAGATEVDANGDGLLSMAEVQAVYVDVTAEQFAAMDINDDGALEDAEVRAAQEAGLLPSG